MLPDFCVRLVLGTCQLSQHSLGQFLRQPLIVSLRDLLDHHQLARLPTSNPDSRNNRGQHILIMAAPLKTVVATGGFTPVRPITTCLSRSLQTLYTALLRHGDLPFLDQVVIDTDNQ